MWGGGQLHLIWEVAFMLTEAQRRGAETMVRVWVGLTWVGASHVCLHPPLAVQTQCLNLSPGGCLPCTYERDTHVSSALLAGDRGTQGRVGTMWVRGWRSRGTYGFQWVVDGCTGSH